MSSRGVPLLAERRGDLFRGVNAGVCGRLQMEPGRRGTDCDARALSAHSLAMTSSRMFFFLSPRRTPGPSLCRAHPQPLNGVKG